LEIRMLASVEKPETFKRDRWKIQSHIL